MSRSRIATAVVLLVGTAVMAYLIFRYPGVDPGPWTHRNYR